MPESKDVFSGFDRVLCLVEVHNPDTQRGTNGINEKFAKAADQGPRKFMTFVLLVVHNLFASALRNTAKAADPGFRLLTPVTRMHRATDTHFLPWAKAGSLRRLPAVPKPVRRKLPRVRQGPMSQQKSYATGLFCQ